MTININGDFKIPMVDHYPKQVWIGDTPIVPSIRPFVNPTIVQGNDPIPMSCFLVYKTAMRPVLTGSGKTYTVSPNTGLVTAPVKIDDGGWVKFNTDFLSGDSQFDYTVENGKPKSLAWFDHANHTFVEGYSGSTKFPNSCGIKIEQLKPYGTSGAHCNIWVVYRANKNTGIGTDYPKFDIAMATLKRSSGFPISSDIPDTQYIATNTYALDGATYVGGSAQFYISKASISWRERDISYAFLTAFGDVGLHLTSDANNNYGTSVTIFSWGVEFHTAKEF
ncbi:MAG: hypothetical protein MJY89_06060 [Bacteroidales bacterium]|nr:hypothetical protein [Bacteroidales bacterium]